MSHELGSHLAQMASSLLDADPYETEKLHWALNISREEIIKAYHAYHLGVDTCGNEVFDSVALRYAMHLSNRIPGSWHLVRQRIVSDLVKSIAPRRTVEVGFGTPQQYLREEMLRATLRSQTVTIHLLDLGYTSMIFGQSVLSLWNDSWSRVVRFRSYDMQCGCHVGDYDCYIFQDSIEHVLDPTSYLSNLVQKAPREAHFIFSLPIEVIKVMPQHFISWRDTNEVRVWLEQNGLTIIFQHEIAINREIDIYAQKLHPNYRQVVFHCKKI